MFNHFFQCLTGNDPFPYQSRFAIAAEIPDLVHAPTGAGKTATAIVGWLWRYFKTDAPTPRRLVYCLPMRVLVEQTRDEALRWIDNLEELEPGLKGKVKVHVLMGGEDAQEWDLRPEAPAILIGTQDMLLSRALNRGYGMSRFRWPIQFGLLNNDALWILDEIQLMGNALATSTQLQAFREAIGTYGASKTVWMSATLQPSWLSSVDFRDRITPTLNLATLSLDPHTDYRANGLQERWNAHKPVSAAQVPNATKDPKALAAFVKDKHVPGTITLVIVNTVDRSIALFEAIQHAYQPKGRRGSEAADTDSSKPDLKLIHSRFRPFEREHWRKWLTESPSELQESSPNGRVIISTQVVEAGVDLSARTLITDLAPWPSLVQRFGRCNRRGEYLANNSAQIFWIDVPTPDDRSAAPYSKTELDAAREQLAILESASPRALAEAFAQWTQGQRDTLFPYRPTHVLRRRDFIDLFDTSPDLSGNDIDVSRFIRDTEEIDVQVFWRDGPPPNRQLGSAEAKVLAPVREELCNVKMAKDGGMKGWLIGKHQAWIWDALSSRWVKGDAASVFPGQVYWIDKADGGYDPRRGWKADCPWVDGTKVRDPYEDQADDSTLEPTYDSDLLSRFGWQTIAEHTSEVVAEQNQILNVLNISTVPRRVLDIAARWHDWGKAHPVFQNAIRDETAETCARPGPYRGRRDLAKAPSMKTIRGAFDPDSVAEIDKIGFWKRYARPRFRHELASALAVLTLLNQLRPPADWSTLSPSQQNLALYLMASHHGKLRMTIRVMPEERPPKDPKCLFACGIWQGDSLPETALGNGEDGLAIVAPQVSEIDVTPMRMGSIDGHPSWSQRMLSLRDSHRGHATQEDSFGPFKLAFLEAILRAADMRASKAAEQRTLARSGDAI